MSQQQLEIQALRAVSDIATHLKRANQLKLIELEFEAKQLELEDDLKKRLKAIGVH